MESILISDVRIESLWKLITKLTTAKVFFCVNDVSKQELNFYVEKSI